MLGSLSLKARLGAGAALLGLAALVTAAILVLGMAQVSQRLQAALVSEQRMDRYAALSTQVSTFIVVTTEAIQTRLPADQRADRIGRVSQNVRQTFAVLRSDLAAAVADATALGLDEQSRRATRTLVLARMEALFESAVRGLTTGNDDQARLRAHLDTFAAGFEPLLGDLVNEETRLRTSILNGIEGLRLRLTRIALAIAAVTVALLAGFHFGLIRPQLRRLDALGEAARRVGAEDFSVVLPDTRRDEIGRLYAETNRMTGALAARKAEVDREWTRLNDTIARRTEELRGANARLERTDEDRRRFFADISHELRTPLTVILMEAQLGRRAAPEAADAFVTIENRAARLNRRIDDLLRVARSETGQLALDTAPFDLGAMLASVAEETKAEVANAGMTLETAHAQGLRAHGDANWLRQVTAGLVRNAVRHARSGGIVRLSAQTGGDFAEIGVEDMGPGIPPERQAGIFGRFAQGEGGPRREGFGLGLALARWVVEEQGGTISVQSPLAADKGTKITVRIPLAED